MIITFYMSFENWTQALCKNSNHLTTKLYFQLLDMVYVHQILY